MSDEELRSMLATPSLPEALSTTVHAIARGELPAADTGAAIPLRLALTGAVVPTLLVTAVAVRTVETAEVAAKIYEKE